MINKEFTTTTKKYNIIDLLWIILAYRKIIIITLLISIIIGLGTAFIVSRDYKSVTRVLPPKETNILSGLGSVASLIRSLPPGLSKLQKSDDQYDYIAILRSRTVSEEVIKKFDLIQVYKISNQSVELAIKELLGNTEIDWTEENTLEIRVWDQNAKRAAEIANEYVYLLNRRSYEIQTQEARNNRIFIEQRLTQNKRDLFEAEQAMKEYQKKSGMIVILDPTSTGISSIAQIYGEKLKKEVELSLLKQTVNPISPLFQQTEKELKSINNEIDKIPDIGVQSLRLYREVAIQQKILEFMIPLYEEAKVNENKDVPIAYVLDAAIPGERPDRPKRSFILGIAVFIGFIVTFLIIVGKEYFTDLQNDSPERYSRLKEMKQIIFHLK